MRVLVIGASGLVGGAAADALRGAHDVIEASRTGEHPVDITDAASIARLFAEVGQVDAVINAVGSVPWRRLDDLTPADYEAAFRGKVLAQIDVARFAQSMLADDGSITLTTGILARAAVPTGAAAAMANGAIESFVIAAAAELTRGIRINAVSPTVLAEATGYHELFAGYPPVPALAVGEAYRALVEGDMTGTIVPVE
jgi:NADP-dependent 3-hydroxy acid dehydrogenase YdfG